MENKFDYHPDGYLTLKNGRRVGYKNSKGYQCVTVDRKMVRVHRIVFYLHNGYWPEIVDHINGDVNDNRIENLREVTAAQNTWNRGGTKGYERVGNKYRVQVMRKGVKHRITVDTEDEAKELREFMKQELHEGYAR